MHKDDLKTGCQYWIIYDNKAITVTIIERVDTVKQSLKSNGEVVTTVDVKIFVDRVIGSVLPEKFYPTKQDLLNSL